MNIVKTHYSNNRSIHNYIYNKPSTYKSEAAYLLLINKLSFQEEKESIKWAKFRRNFLNKQHINGILICTYCNKDVSNLPTIDHIHPLSKGGAKYDEKNCCVSCSKCNSNKSDNVL